VVYVDPALRSPEPITALWRPILACPPVTVFSPASTPKSVNCTSFALVFFFPFFNSLLSLVGFVGLFLGD
jgi:hypothetical protein